MLRKMWNNLFSPKPFHEGYLPQADGHDVWFAEYGNPEGEPILITHGGPGGRCRAAHVKMFDMQQFRVIMLDQRGCGKSLPAGELKHNTTEDILFDMARLLEFLEISEPVILRGASWGATLMLLFAERYPKQVKKLLLSQVFLADEASEKWENEQCGLFYPDMLEQLRKPLKSWQTVPEYYLKQLTDGDASQQKKALETYGYFERVLGSLSPHWQHLATVDDKYLNATRIYAHYAAHHYFMKSNEIMRHVKKIKDIPTLIVHNRLDMLCPLQGAYNLSKKLDKCKLVIVPEKGHVGKLLSKVNTREIKDFL